MPSLEVINEDLMQQYVETLGIQTEIETINNLNLEVAQSMLSY